MGSESATHCPGRAGADAYHQNKLDCCVQPGVIYETCLCWLSPPSRPLQAIFSTSRILNAIKASSKSKPRCIVENVLNMLGSQADTSARLLFVTLYL